MTGPMLKFSRGEYADRLAKTRRAMDAKGVDLLIVTDPSNMAWLTGYDGWSFYVHQCVLLGLEGQPIWYGRAQDANGAKRTTFLSDDNIVPYPDYYVQSEVRHPMDYLAGVIRDRGLEKKRIGVEMDNYYFSAACFASLERHLTGATFVDATGLVNWQRAVKSPQEILYMRAAARIVEAIHARIYEMIEPGLPKNRLVAEIYRTGIAGVDGYGGDYPRSCRCCLRVRMRVLPTSPGTSGRSSVTRAPSSRSPAATSAITARSHGPCSWASPLESFLTLRRPYSKGLTQASSRRGRAIRVKTSPRHFSPCSTATASSRKTERAMPSGLATHRIGASGP